MRIATWNLLHGVALHAQQSETTLAAEARRIAADVIAIQEVDYQQPRSSHHHQTQDIARALELEHWYFVPAILGTPGVDWMAATDEHIHHHQFASEPMQPRYGIGLASRYPMTDIEILRFPPAKIPMPLLVPTPQGNKFFVVQDEPRVAMLATLDTPQGLLSIGTAHCSFVPGTNIKQLRSIAQTLEQRPGHRMLLGDFNLIGKIPQLITRWSSLAKLRTYPAHNAKVQFDHILASGFTPDAVRNMQQSAQSLALAMSDHNALVIDARWSN